MIFYSIIIVNYKSPVLAADCIHSIFQTGVPASAELVVVDNFSQDNSREIITTRFPQVKWIQMEYNAGFARANNEGIRQSEGDIVLLLNPDTLNQGNAVMECFGRLKASGYGAAGVQLLNPDGSPQISGNYFMTGGLNHLMALPYIGRVIRWLGYTLKVKKTNVSRAEGTVEVDWINGAFLMVKKEVIEKAGLLDEDFFLYSEEIEWCSRLRKTGKMCIYGDLHVIHLEGGVSNDAFKSAGKGYQKLDDRKGLQILLSGLVRIRKQYGTGWFLFHLLACLTTIPAWFIILVFKTLFFLRGTGKEWKSWRGFASNVFIVCAYFFRIVRNRPYFYKVL
jgi:GT2 family glycosyltransferase